MIKRVIFTSAAVVAGSYLVYSLNKEKNNTVVEAPVVHAIKEAPIAPKAQRGDQVLSTGIDTFVPKKASTGNDIQLNSNENDTIIWQESEVSKKVLTESGLIPADVTDEAYIELDREELLTVEVGEYLDLYIPQFGGSYTGEVDHIETHPNGDRTVEAHIPGAGSLYAAVITIGENATYANLATPRDVFVLEGNDKYAWIAPKSSMMQSHIEHELGHSESTHQQNGNDTTDVFDLPETESPTGNQNNKKGNKMKRTFKCFTAMAAALLCSTAVSAATIDVLVLYTQPAANSVSNIDTKINQYISHANRVYRNNAVDLQLRIVGAQSSAATSSNLQPTEDALDLVTNSSGVKNFRSSVRADMVVLLGKRENIYQNGQLSGYVCGIGWVGQGNNGTLYSSSKDRMYSISAVDCGLSTFVHELGHNMGLGHSVRQNSVGGVYRDGIGHGVDNNFSTIMAYPQAFGSATQLDYFSDPYWNGCNGQACGVPNQSNAYRAVNAVINQIANYF